MIRRALLGLIVSLATSVVVWFAVVGPPPSESFSLVEAAEFPDWWEQAEERDRARAIKRLLLPDGETRAHMKSLVRSDECLEWADEDFYRRLGRAALDELQAFALRREAEDELRECAFSLAMSVADRAEQLRFLTLCVEVRDQWVQIEAARWIDDFGADEGFVPNDQLRYALARLVERYSWRGPDPADSWEYARVALAATLDPEGKQLTALLADDDPIMRRAAAEIAYAWHWITYTCSDVEIGSASKEEMALSAVAILLPALSDPDADVRERALASLEAFACIGTPIPSAAVMALLADAQQPDSTRVAAVKALAGQGGGVVLLELQPYLHDPVPAVRAAVLEATYPHCWIDPPRDFEARVLTLLADPDAGVRAAAASALYVPAEDPRATCRVALLKGLDDEDERVRLACVRALHHYRGAPAIEAVEHLARWMESGSQAEREEAVLVFRGIPRLAAPYRSALRALMAEGDAADRVELLGTLKSAARHDSTLAVALEYANDDSPDVRLAVFELLISRFAERTVVVDALKTALDDSSSHVVVLAVKCTKQHGLATAAIVRACIRLLEDDDTLSRHARTAIGVLGECGPDARPAIPTLLWCLDHPPWFGSGLVVGVFAKLPEFSDEFVPPIVERAARYHTLAVAALVLLEPRTGKQIDAAVAKLTPEQQETLEKALAERRRLGPIKPAVQIPGR